MTLGLIGFSGGVLPKVFFMRLQPHGKWSLSKITHSHCFWLMLLPGNSTEPILYRATIDLLFLGLPICPGLFKAVPIWESPIFYKPESVEQSKMFDHPSAMASHYKEAGFLGPISKVFFSENFLQKLQAFYQLTPHITDHFLLNFISQTGH